MRISKPVHFSIAALILLANSAAPTRAANDPPAIARVCTPVVAANQLVVSPEHVPPPGSAPSLR